MADSDSKAKETVAVAAIETTEVTEKRATTVRQRLFGRFADSLDPAVVIGLAVLLLIATALWAAFGRGSSLLSQLQEQAYARGLITYIFTVGTLGIALTLVGSALFGNTSDESFRRAREVFSVLAGVLGTIVGFYFGSTGQDGHRPTLDAVRVAAVSNALQLTAFVKGGTPPFEYDVDVEGRSVKADAPSQDGWILESLGPVVALEGELRIKDAKGQVAETKFTYPASAASTAPTPVPPTTTTPTSTTTTTLVARPATP
jgi:hypothetical protein